MGNKRSDAVSAEHSEEGRRVRWRKNTAAASADSIDVFQGGFLKGALVCSHLTKTAFQILEFCYYIFSKTALPADLAWCFKVSTLFSPVASMVIFLAYRFAIFVRLDRAAFNCLNFLLDSIN